MTTIKVPMQVVDVQTGEVTEEKISEWQLAPVDTSDGKCPECAVKHEATEPHNAQSLAYQYHFFAKHNRWPTWGDAMAHCEPGVQDRVCIVREEKQNELQSALDT